MFGEPIRLRAEPSLVSLAPMATLPVPERAAPVREDRLAIDGEASIEHAAGDGHRLVGR